MARKEFTEADKAAYVQRKKHALEQYRLAKAYAEQNPDDVAAMVAAAQAAVNFPISPFSFMYVFMQMSALKLDGVPYLDVKTFHAWKDAGRKVKRGEKSKLDSITWISSDDGKTEHADDGEGGGRRWPKMTALFHITQTEEMTADEIERHQQGGSKRTAAADRGGGVATPQPARAGVRPTAAR